MQRTRSGRIIVRVANPSNPKSTNTMATKKKRAKKRTKRRNPSSAKKHPKKTTAAPRKRRRNPGHMSAAPKRKAVRRRRRRNPGGPETATMATVKALAAGVATGVLCMVAAAYIPSRWAGYGLSAAGVAGGLGLASMGHKSIGMGVAVGAAAGSLVPLAGSKLLAALSPSANETSPQMSGYQDVYPTLGGYQDVYPTLGGYQDVYPQMGTVVADMGTVVADMGTVVADMGNIGGWQNPYSPPNFLP